MVVLIVQPVLKTNTFGSTIIQEGQSLTSKKDSASMERDKLYNQLIETLARYEAVWKQQAGNVEALKQYSTELLEHVSTLHGFHERRESISEPTPSKKLSAKEAVVKAPTGPVKLSRTPSSEDEIRKRMDATEKFHKGPFENSLKSRTLVGVPDAWIDSLCNLAEEEITKINKLLEVEPIVHDAFEIALEQLRKILYQLNTPPSGTAPVTSKDSKQ